MADDLGYDAGNLTPFLKGIGLALFALNATMGLIGWAFGG